MKEFSSKYLVYDYVNHGKPRLWRNEQEMLGKVKIGKVEAVLTNRKKSTKIVRHENNVMFAALL